MSPLSLLLLDRPFPLYECLAFLGWLVIITSVGMVPSMLMLTTWSGFIY